MTALVIKSWKASDTPLDAEGSHIAIVGRASGLISWILQLVGIDPTHSLRVSEDKIDLKTSSLSGYKRHLCPLENISFTSYGYHRPWKQALGLFFVLWFVLSAIVWLLAMWMSGSRGFGDAGASMLLSRVLAFLIAAPIALAYYFLGRTLTLGWTMECGHPFEMRFKRSVIENMEINEKQAAYVCELLEFLADQKRNGDMLTTA